MGPSLSDFKDSNSPIDLGDIQFLFDHEVGTDAQGTHEERINKAKTGSLDAEDGWSFPVSVYLANQVEASRSSSVSAGGRSLNETPFQLDDNSAASRPPFMPQSVALYTAPDVQVDKTSDRLQVEDQIPVAKDAEKGKPALAPPR